MKFVTIISEEYAPVYNLTLPYMPKDVEVLQLPKTNGVREFGTAEFNLLTRFPETDIVNVMKKMNNGDILFSCDSDVLLNAPVEWFIEQLKDNDIIFQSDRGDYCCGFYVLRISPKIIRLFESVNENTNSQVNNQVALNRIKHNFKDIKFAMFDTKDVWNYGCLDRGVWNGEDSEFPDNLKAFHANYTIGIDNKVKLLEMATKKYK